MADTVKTLIENAAKEVGITALVANAKDKIETQLNKLTDVDKLPIALIPWDLESTSEFGDNGFLTNPTTVVRLLLMTKAKSLTKEDMENASFEMNFQIICLTN